VSLSEGEVEDGHVECWLHGSMFDLRTGRPTGLPATRPVPTFPVTVEGDDVLVQMES
jgi:3-phenylpropionate/trans-cinnamate dioxygenase ferredoxin subunit